MSRQLSLEGQKSFFVAAEHTLKMYSLPPSSQLENFSKLAWKKMTRQSINSFWTRCLVEEAQTKSSLINCDLSSMSVGVTHIVWESASNNLHDIRRSITKVRMMTGVDIRVGVHAHGVAFLFFSGEYFGFFQQFQAESLTISSSFFIYLH